MPKYYFHRHLNGMVVRDQSGTSLRDESEACAYAVRCTPLTLRKSVIPRRNTYLALEVSDGQTHPVCRERESGHREALRPPQSGGLL